MNESDADAYQRVNCAEMASSPPLFYIPPDVLSLANAIRECYASKPEYHNLSRGLIRGFVEKKCQESDKIPEK